MKKSLVIIVAFVFLSFVKVGHNNNVLVVNQKNENETSKIAIDTTLLSKTSELLDEEKFWTIIDHSLTKSHNQEEQEHFLLEEIEQLSPTEIIGFQLRTNEFLYETYNSEMWCAGYIMNGGCSDDGFEYFRCWLISRGKNTFYSSKTNPDYLANEIVEGTDFYDFESFWNVATTAFRNKTGKELYDYVDNDKLKTNEENYPEFKFTWQENDLESMKKICPNLFLKVMK